ncbi:MAG TPA: hypothetical protein DCW68_00490 [Rhodospirillaceae bacterium]|nr:hypothetical protein [Rhodospirillaceae bacterium]
MSASALRLVRPKINRNCSIQTLKTLKTKSKTARRCCDGKGVGQMTDGDLADVMRTVNAGSVIARETG